VVFYDINDKVIVKRIKTETPLQSVSFCADGHTIAIGANNYGAILVYDLRKSSKEVAKICTGHMSTINSLRFMNKPAAKSDEGRTPKFKSSEVPQSKTSDIKPFDPLIKTAEQIKEEAKRAAMIKSKPSEVRKDVSPEPRADTKTERLEQVTKQHSAQRQQQ